MNTSKLGLGGVALIAALVVMLAAALWYAAGAWLTLSGPPMPAVGYVAMGFGIFFFADRRLRPDGAGFLFKPPRL